jgi:hypothetical protein
MTVVRESYGETWYVEAVSYPSGLMAKRAWEHVHAKLKLERGDDGAGITRLAPNPDGNAIPTGLNKPLHAVVVVTTDQRVMEKAKRLLKDGEPWEPVAEFCDTLIARRARMLQGRLAHALQQQKGGGDIVIRRPEGRGARVYESGQIREFPPGRG